MTSTPKKRRYAAIRLAGCVLAGAAGMLAFTLSPEGYVGVSDLPLRVGSVGWLIYTALLACLFWLATGGYGVRLTPGIAGAGLLFGFIDYFATTLFAYDTWSFLNSAGAWAIAALCILGQSVVMAAAVSLVCGWLERGGATRRGPDIRRRRSLPDGLARPLRRLAALYRRRPTLTTVLFLLVCWSPFLAAFFPGTIIWDMGEMLGQLYGLRPMTNWHPLLTTWLFGGCVGLGRLLHSDNLGAFLFTALQTLALAYALGETLRLMRRFSLRRGFQIAALAFFGLTPIFGAFAQAVGKDTLYTAALLLFVLRTVETLRFGALHGRALAGYAFWALLACLVRTNGLYVVLVSAALTVAFGVRGRSRLRVGGALAGALAAAMLFSYALIPALGIADVSASGFYSVLFQQSARALRDHAATVTPGEMAELDRVLDAADLPALYEANISDPVKYTFKVYGEGRDAETQALARYRSTWVEMLKKYPLTYAEAFIAGNTGYYAFTPKIDAARTYNNQGGIRFVFETYELGDDPRYLHTTQIAPLENARVLLAAYARGWRRVPLLEIALFCPVYTWGLLEAALSLARRKRWRDLIAFAPALLSFGVCLLSPVNDYFRYFLPVVAMSPMLLGLAYSRGTDQPDAVRGGILPPDTSPIQTDGQ